MLTVAAEREPSPAEIVPRSQAIQVQTDSALTDISSFILETCRCRVSFTYLYVNFTIHLGLVFQRTNAPF